MKLLDRIALNRLIKIITDFILAILKICKPEKNDTIVTPVKKYRFPWVRKKINDIITEE